MTDIISFIISIIDYLGTTKTIIILIISFCLLLLLMYISVLAEYSSLRDIIRFRPFIVIATTKDSKEPTTIKLRAWGRLNALEKAAKK